MRRLTPFLALALAFLIAACSPKAGTAVTSAAQQPDPAPATPQKSYAPTVSDTALLWTISGQGLPEPSYLFGTIHLIPADDYFLPTGMVAALNDADEVIFEIDPQEMQNPMAMMQMMGKINMRGDTSLSDLLSEEEYATVEAYFSEKGLPMFLFKRMKPMFLSALVGQDMEGMAPGGMGGLGGGMGGNMKSYELEMTELAQTAEKEISGLETIDFQLSLFDSIPYRAQAQTLLKAIEQDRASDGGDGPDPMAEIVDMYRRKAIAEMAGSIRDMADESSRFEELLLTKRNLNWIPAIEEKMAGGTPKLFAVGAAHLGGEQGVIALLRRAGYVVEPVYQ